MYCNVITYGSNFTQNNTHLKFRYVVVIDQLNLRYHIIYEKTKYINIITTSLKHLHYINLQYVIIIQLFGSTSGNAHSALKKIYGIYIEG